MDSRYMVLATADKHGTPWASPVWYANPTSNEFLWISDPNARHSRNIAARPEIGLVIFDSTVDPGNAAAIYAAARAEQLSGDELAAGVEAFSAESVNQRLGAFTLAEVTGSAKHRLYRATVHEFTQLGAGDRRIPLAR